MESKEIQTTQWVLIGTMALFFDVIQIGVNFIPVVGWILSPMVTIFGWLVLWLSLKLKGVNILTKTTAIFSFSEFIPIFNSLPTLTAIVVKRYFDIKSQKTLSRVPGGTAVATVSKTAMTRGVSMKDFASKESRQELYKDLKVKEVFKNNLKTNTREITKKQSKPDYEDFDDMAS